MILDSSQAEAAEVDLHKAAAEQVAVKVLAEAEQMTVERLVKQVQGTINGYGERTGNCNLTSVIPILQLKLGMNVVPRLEKLRDLSYFVDDVSNNPHFARAAFIGRT